VILNNGLQTDEPPTLAKRGPRGGIFITTCIGPTDPVPRIPNYNGLWSNGVPALNVQENIVSAPLGRALTATAIGSVSVVGNQFTSQEWEPGDFKVTTVLILNLGIAIDDQSSVKRVQTLKAGQQVTTSPSIASRAELRPSDTLSAQAISTAPQLLLNGSVLFTNNQCLSETVGTRGTTTGLANIPPTVFGASIVIFTRDDIGFHANQCECLFAFSKLLSNVGLLSLMSLRVSDNRFKEGIGSVAFSGITLGRLNMTTDNQATHCLLIAGPSATRVNTPNTILTGTGPCLELNRLFDQIFK
jgi:hypothetical protein